MPGLETPPSPEPVLSRREKEQLLQKMYGKPHWIAVIRLFGYRVMPMDEARQAIKPIADEYGKEPVAEACESLVEISTHGKDAFARLKSHIRRMAFQILGAEEVAAAPRPSEDSGQQSRPPKQATETKKDERPVHQPRHHVLGRYQEWLNEAGFAFVSVEEVRRTTPAVQPFIAGLDFIVLQEERKLLVTVRPHLQAKHRTAIAEILKLFGDGYTAVRVWPTEEADGWNWQENAIDPSET